MFDWGFNANKLKPQLKMAVHRFQMASNKKTALLKQNMREVAVLLAEDPPKEEKARIRAEALIRDDYMVEAYDILSLNCELLSERIKLIEHSKECPPDLVSTIATLIYAAPRVDIPELVTIRKQFRAKYGKKFEEDAMNNVGGVLNERVVTKLSVQPPAAFLVQTYLEQICDKFEVDWSPTQRLSVDQMGEPMAPPVGFSVQIAQGTGLGHQVSAHTGMTVNGDGDDEITYTDGPSPTNIKSTSQQWKEPPPAPTSSANQSTMGSTITTQRNEEPDIFIPPAPGQSASSLPPPIAPQSNSTKKDGDNNDDDDENGGVNASSSGSAGNKKATYEDLAARFDNLKNL